MKIINAQDIDQALDFPSLIDALGTMFAHGCTAPPRHHHTKTNAESPDQTVLLMPAWNERFITTKIVCVTPDNGARGLPAVMANVIVMDAGTGQPVAMIDGARLTLWRTAAASALAARYLRRCDANKLLVVGAGALAPFLVRAHCAEHNFDSIGIWNRNHQSALEKAAALCVDGFDVQVAGDLDAAVAEADLISCATLSTAPLVKGRLLKAGAHLDLVGAFTPKMRETDDDCVTRAGSFVDTYAGALQEGGDLVQPMAAGIIQREDIQAELAELVSGKKQGRSSEKQITLFKSTGASLEDLAAATLVCDRMSVG